MAPRTRLSRPTTADRSARDRAVTGAVERWFSTNARELPWRPRWTPRDPYHGLVSEAMLQQTQVSRVVAYFTAFIERFPTVHALAAADEGAVLGLWSGLGYYRRARSLHAAARAIVADFGGEFPRTAAELQQLPGVGRYTAGAISSIVFNHPAAIVDGNVARVLLRIENRPPRHADPADPATQRWTWERAEGLVAAAASPALFNEGLMELGATVCTPRSPRCDACPLSKLCLARAAGTQERIPIPKPAPRTKHLYCASIVAADPPRGKLLVEQRSTPGVAGTMWAGLWQAPTLERDDRPHTPAEIAAAIGLPAGSLAQVETFIHKTTHRTVHFHVWSARFAAAAGRRRTPRRGEWLDVPRVADLGLSNPQRRILLGKKRGGRLPVATAP